jgi:hypothetical protein
MQIYAITELYSFYAVFIQFFRQFFCRFHTNSCRAAWGLSQEKHYLLFHCFSYSWNASNLWNKWRNCQELPPVVVVKRAPLTLNSRELALICIIRSFKHQFCSRESLFQFKFHAVQLGIAKWSQSIYALPSWEAKTRRTLSNESAFQAKLWCPFKKLSIP